MSRGPRVPLEQARALAARVCAALAPGCERLEVVGSVRRGKADVGDLELLAVPRRALDLFGTPAGSLLDPLLEALVAGGSLGPARKDGPRYKQYPLARSGLTLDLFLTTPPQWGVLQAVRTGPAEWSKRLVTPRPAGLLPAGWRVEGGRLADAAGRLLDTPDEAALFAALGLAFVPPAERA